MLQEDRFSRILAIVDAEGSVTVTDLVRRMEISESTIRRDLTAMDKKGLLTKVYGGAISLKGRPELTARDENIGARKALYTEDKARIAEYAASLIGPEDFVFLDAGTTTEMMIEYVTARQAVFVTHAVSHALKLAAREFRVYLLGGELKSITETALGEETLEALEKYQFTKGFFGTNGIGLAEGCTTPDPREAAIKTRAMRASRHSFILADISKFSASSNVRFADFQDAKIITTGDLDPELKKQKNVILVPSAGLE